MAADYFIMVTGCSLLSKVRDRINFLCCNFSDLIVNKYTHFRNESIVRSVTNVKYDHYPKHTFKEIKKPYWAKKPKKKYGSVCTPFTLKTLVGKIISDSEKRNMWWAKNFFQKGLNCFQEHLTEERGLLPNTNRQFEATSEGSSLTSMTHIAQHK